MTEVVWEAPGPGQWWHDREHLPGPSTPMWIDLFLEPARAGWERGAAEVGLPPPGGRFAVVNGWLLWGGAPDWAPNDAELAAMADRAAAAVRDRMWRAEMETWRTVDRPEAVAACRALQAVAVDALDDASLAEHLEACRALFQRLTPLHFAHHGELAVGYYVQEGEALGVSPAELLGLLAGSSSASAAPARMVAAIGAALDLAGAGPVATLEDVRATPAAARLLDEYLDEYGWRIVGDHDLHAPALVETPEIVVRTIEAARRRTGPAVAPPPDALEATVLERLPAEQRERFAELLADARAGYGLRDDDVGVCFMWPLGLVRRAALAAAGRAAVAGRLASPDSVFDLTVGELAGILRGRAEPTAEEIAIRHERRRRAASLTVPVPLGEADPTPEPPLPDAVTDLQGILRRYDFAGTGTRDSAPEGVLVGLGVGSGSATGPARVVHSAQEALDGVEPGDVLVTVMTSPGYNAVLPGVAALVTEEGGLTSHAGIVARELGLPAVLGVTGVVDRVTDGQLVEVDAAKGTVRVLA